MHSGGFPWLSLLLVLPLAGAVAMYFVTESTARWIALAATMADLFVALPLKIAGATGSMLDPLAVV